MKPLLILIFILFLIIVPVFGDKSKGLFSGDYLKADLDLFTSDVSDIPEYLSDNQSAVQSNPQDIGSWMDIGKTQLKSGNWKAAADTFSKVIDKDPTNTDGWEGYLLAIRGDGNFEELLDASERATQENPNFASAWKYNGIALSSLDRSDEALTSFEKALKVDPKFYDSWYYKGIALDSLKRYSDSVKAYEQVVALNENFTKAWNNKGVALLYIGNYDQAISAFDKALLIDPNFQKASENKGLAIQEKSKSSPISVVTIDDAAIFIPSSGSQSGGGSAVITVSPTKTPVPISDIQEVQTQEQTSVPTTTSTPKPQATLQIQPSNEITTFDVEKTEIIETGTGIQTSNEIGGITHTYQLVYSPDITWEKANAAAINAGGHLATITSESENAFLTNLATKDPQVWNCYNGHCYGPWLGGYQKEGSTEPRDGWAWVTNEPWIYSNWESRQPDNYCGENRLQYVGVNLKPDGLWNDANGCSYNQMNGYIIEWDKPTPNSDTNEVQSEQPPSASSPTTIAQKPQIDTEPVKVSDGRETFIAQDDSGWALSMNTNGPWHYAYCVVPNCNEDTQNPNIANGNGIRQLSIDSPKFLGIRAWVSGPGDGKSDYELNLYYGSTLVSQVSFPLKGQGIFGVFNPGYETSSGDKTVTCKVNAVSQGACMKDDVELDCRPP